MRFLPGLIALVALLTTSLGYAQWGGGRLVEEDTTLPQRVKDTNAGLPTSYGLPVWRT